MGVRLVLVPIAEHQHALTNSMPQCWLFEYFSMSKYKNKITKTKKNLIDQTTKPNQQFVVDRVLHIYQHTFNDLGFVALASNLMDDSNFKTCSTQVHPVKISCNDDTLWTLPMGWIG